jgi:hypothetical protein
VKVTRHRASIRARFSLAEAHVLEQLLDELAIVLRPGALPDSHPVRERLYPAGYADPEEAAAYRELTESGLEQDRCERLERCRAELHKARSLVRTDLVLSADAADRWIRVLNDLRLTLGTRLDVAEDDDYDLHEDDPDVQERARYVWLSALQDLLVTALMS